MHASAKCLLAMLSIGVIAGICHAQSADAPTTFPPGIILIGTQTQDEQTGCGIGVMSPAGGDFRTLFRFEKGGIYAGGRLSPGRNRLAACHWDGDDSGRFMTIDAAGESTKITDGIGTVTAWSPDGRQIAFYRGADDQLSYESFVVDLTSGKETKLELPADYVADDWHPHKNTRTVIYMNPRNLLYREKKGDHYPTRQLDLMAADGKTAPITKHPCTDNIWSRFSPSGDRIAHYGRRLVGEKSLEYVVVCNADGSEPREVFNFTEYGDTHGLPWFRPKGPPAWSPDGSQLAWLVNTNTESISTGEKLELVLISVSGGEPTRISLTAEGFTWVSDIEWR